MESLPFEVGLEKAKQKIVMAINQVGMEYEIPSALLGILISEIAMENKINHYSTIIGAYDISVPKEMNKNEE